MSETLRLKASCCQSSSEHLRLAIKNWTLPQLPQFWLGSGRSRGLQPERAWCCSQAPGTQPLPGRDQLACQLADTSTYERFSAAMDVHPRSLRVRSTSARKISSARATPASPAAPRPYA